MLNFLDIKTLLFITGIINSVLCGCMLYVYKTRKTYDGFQLWSLASIFYFIAFVFMSLRHILPDFFTIIIGNTLIIAGNGCVVHGLEVFTNSRRRLMLFVTLTLSVSVLFTYYTYAQPSVNSRIVVISIVIAVIYFYSAYILYESSKRLAWITNVMLSATFSILAIWNVARVGQTLFYEGLIVDFLQSSSFHSTTIVLFCCGNVVIVIGLIVLNFQRVENDLRDANLEVKGLREILPICSYCHKIRNDAGYYERIEAYMERNINVDLSHTICDECLNAHFPEVDRDG